MVTLEELLAAQIETGTIVKELKHRLFGEEQEKGDIPEIKDHLAEINGSLRKQNSRLTKVELKTKIILWGLGLVVIPSGSLAATLTKIWGIW